jgi:hypothetical protein
MHRLLRNIYIVSFLHEKMDLFYPKQIGSMAFQVNPQVAPASARDGVDTRKKDLTEPRGVKRGLASCAWGCVSSCLICGRNPAENQSVYCGMCMARTMRVSRPSAVGAGAEVGLPAPPPLSQCLKERNPKILLGAGEICRCVSCTEERDNWLFVLPVPLPRAPVMEAPVPAVRLTECGRKHDNPIFSPTGRCLECEVDWELYEEEAF